MSNEVEIASRLDVRYDNPLVMFGNYVKEELSDAYKLFIEIISALENVPEQIFPDSIVDFGALLPVLKDGKSTLSCFAFFTKLGESWTEFCKFVDSLDRYYFPSNVVDRTNDVAAYDVIESFRLFTRATANCASKLCEGLKLFDSHDVVEVPYIELIGGLKYFFTAYYLANTTYSDIDALFIHPEKFKKECERGLNVHNVSRTLPSEAHENYTYSTAWSLVKNTSGFIVNALSLAGLILGFTLASPLLLVLSSVSIIASIACFVFKKHGDSYKAAVMKLNTCPYTPTVRA